MIYFKFKSESNKKVNQNTGIVIRFLRFILPKSNPDFENRYNLVSTWYIEFDIQNNYTNREVGFNSNGLVIVKAPDCKNLGFWVDTDLKLEDFNKFGIETISTEEFELAWKTNLE